MTAGARSGTRRAVSENLQHIVCYAKVYTLLFCKTRDSRIAVYVRVWEANGRVWRHLTSVDQVYGFDWHF